MMTFSEIPHFLRIQELAKKQKRSVILVGGFLRDVCLQRKSCDFDFAVDAHSLKLAKRFSEQIKGAFVILDEERGCARVVKKIKGEIFTYDFADFREETLLKDLKHRDFTINTLTIDVSEVTPDAVVSTCIKDRQKGLQAITAKKIQMVNTKVFKEDPLRILRAFSLKASLRFAIDPKTLEQIKKDLDLIRTVSPERISVEFFKVLESDQAFSIIRQMDQIHLLDKIIPQIACMYKCKQGAYHHLDVWKHSLETVKQVELVLKEYGNDEDVDAYLEASLGGNRTRKALIKLAALLHDVGKPDTRRIDAEGKYSFHAHEHVGKKIVRHIAKALKISTRERYALQDMVQMHLRPGYLSNYKRPTDKAIYRFLRDAKEEAIGILLLSLADQRATRGPLTSEKDLLHHEAICKKLIDRKIEKQKEKPLEKFINGHDIMKMFKIKPCLLVGEILREVEEQQALGIITNHNEAVDYAKFYFNKNT